jgi:hypothetical protein
MAFGATVYVWQQRKLTSYLNAGISHSCRIEQNVKLQATTIVRLRLLVIYVMYNSISGKRFIIFYQSRHFLPM